MDLIITHGQVPWAHDMLDSSQATYKLTNVYTATPSTANGGPLHNHLCTDNVRLNSGKTGDITRLLRVFTKISSHFQ